ncbi:otopetrin-2-like [Centruroides sculpturatus]|uniref:otopetrin-2-like n=1 Tax=Centruroides sculpturatus TaxID=218467 RepID=UPI000C6C8F6C|nr:otopetrin-2-like [Centruroides sculpturatus]XP_023217994.1 otopetrin-2-like [Centruroides sculpturatus]XP_023217995.1 otopetrin-2-like [Centruroides sculpturatus]XP_023217996.1 otopetrin-2-like [Centruroides sculpturatus]
MLSSDVTPARVKFITSDLYSTAEEQAQDIKTIEMPNMNNLKEISNPPSYNENDALVVMLSGVYAKLLMVMGICFPLGEVISRSIPISYYEGFYLYLYIGSISFILFVYVFLLRRERESHKISTFSKILHTVLKTMDTVPRRNSSFGIASPVTKKKVDELMHSGSFYIRLSAVAFGIGCMIYSGLEFGQFFELHTESKCYNILFGLTPFTRMVFTFAQMYFIFLNSTMIVNKYKTIARFGLMHMIAANLCVWLHVLVQETKHGILTSANSTSFPLIKNMNFNIAINQGESANEFSNKTVIDETLYSNHECRRSSIMGKLVQDASQFLFPCVIEHSVIAAAILFMMWKNVGKSLENSTDEKHSFSAKRHYYHVDCTKANKGLFTGIFVLSLSIISIILFFVFINKLKTKPLAVLEARITELVLYLMTSLAVAVSLYQMKELKYFPNKNAELDNYLLVVGQSGLSLFNVFSIIGAIFAKNDNLGLVLLSSSACLIQSTLQTMFIFDASKRRATNSEQMNRKPGREMVTFLLLCNFAMWAINTLETQRVDSNPVLLEFYRFWGWIIILYVTTPLAIYYRFHSTVCLCDIWKKCYKV